MRKKEEFVVFLPSAFTEYSRKYIFSYTILVMPSIALSALSSRRSLLFPREAYSPSYEDTASSPEDREQRQERERKRERKEMHMPSPLREARGLGAGSGGVQAVRKEREREERQRGER